MAVPFVWEATFLGFCCCLYGRAGSSNIANLYARAVRATADARTRTRADAECFDILCLGVCSDWCT